MDYNRLIVAALHKRQVNEYAIIKRYMWEDVRLTGSLVPPAYRMVIGALWTAKPTSGHKHNTASILFPI